MVKLSFAELIKSEAMIQQEKARRVTRKNLVRYYCKRHLKCA